MNEAQKKQIADKIVELGEKLQNELGLKMPPLVLDFDIKNARLFGSAWWKREALFGQKTYGIRINPSMASTPEAWDELLNDTVPHEVAHIICYAYPQLGSGHNKGWKKLCTWLGGNGKRCKTLDTDNFRYGKGKTYLYTASCGKEISVSAVRHNRIQRGTSYALTSTGGSLNKDCKFKVMA